MPVFGAAGLLLYLTAVFCTDGALFGIIPTPDSLQLLRAGIDEGFQNINDFATPVPTTTGLVLLTAGALGLTTIVVDVVAVSLRRPAASGLALLALYAVPVAVVLGGVPWVLFAIAACGYLLLLLVEGRDRLAHWGRPVGATPRSAGAVGRPDPGSAGRGAGAADRPADRRGRDRAGGDPAADGARDDRQHPQQARSDRGRRRHRQRQRPAERVRGAARPAAAGPAGRRS